MIGRLSMGAFIVASGAVQLLPALPPSWLIRSAGLGMALVGLVVLSERSRLRRYWRYSLPLYAALAGLVSTVERAHHRLYDVLAEDNIDKVSRVVLRVSSLPVVTSGQLQFEAEVLESIPTGVPRRIRVTWRGAQWSGPYAQESYTVPDLPRVRPGDLWRMALVLRPPHGLRNPSGFDAEGWAFANGIRARGTVRGTPALLGEERWHSIAIAAQRLRYEVRASLQPYLADKKHAAVLPALAIGDQSQIRATDWESFHLTGITHLVSISGTHVSLIAGLAALLASALWRRLRFNDRYVAERLPAQTMAAWVGLVTAFAYSLLAGWGVPAQRSFLMLAVVGFSIILRLSLGSWRVLILAAFLVVLMDPWALLARGFWLSFGAVAILLLLASAHRRAVNEPRRILWQSWFYSLGISIKVQLAITVALFPVLAYLFNEVSLVSPLANFYAIPIVGLVITPAALLAAVCAATPGLESVTAGVVLASHYLLEWMMRPTEWLAGLPLARLAVAQPPAYWWPFAFGGVALLLLPRGVVPRWMGTLLLLPTLTWSAPRLGQGQWQALVFDVGQGGAVLVRTANHALLFDTGLRHSAYQDSAKSVILPNLRKLGVRRLDVVVVSHADMDHVGGLRSILEQLAVQQIYTSFDVSDWLRRESRLLGMAHDEQLIPAASTKCRYGQSWHIDGVSFQMLWPKASNTPHAAQTSRERNEQSCVLSVQGLYHSLLLPGDIGSYAEEQLVVRGLLAHDAVIAPHHGSKNSSSPAFVGALKPAHVVAQAGAWSRYGHPHSAVIARWDKAGSRFWSTHQQGAMQLTSREDGLAVRSWRSTRPRYWD